MVRCFDIAVVDDCQQVLGDERMGALVDSHLHYFAGAVLQAQRWRSSDRWLLLVAVQLQLFHVRLLC